MIRLYRAPVGNPPIGGFFWINPETAHVEQEGEGEGAKIMVHTTWVSFHADPAKHSAEQIVAWIEEARMQDFMEKQKALMGLNSVRFDFQPVSKG